jgi:hypothetical protein
VVSYSYNREVEMTPDKTKIEKLAELKNPVVDPAVDPATPPDAENETIHVSELTHLNRDHIDQNAVDDFDYGTTPEEAARDQIRQDEPK